MNLNPIRKTCAKTLLGMYFQANAGHIGSSLSCLEILIDLLFIRMRPQDVLILSKGHAAAALYVTLAESGRLDIKELETFYKDGTLLAAHPPCSNEIPAIPFGTGSLGHGLSLAAGIAFSTRFTKKDLRVYCVLSDGDCNEGSTWEAALFASHHRLANLQVIVDRNNLQGIARSDQVLNLEPFGTKWRAFGFATTIASNGNSFSSLNEAFEDPSQKMEKDDAPKCIIAQTVKGHGVSFMENRMEWHYHPMNKDQFDLAVSELEKVHA